MGHVRVIFATDQSLTSLSDELLMNTINCPLNDLREMNEEYRDHMFDLCSKSKFGFNKTKAHLPQALNAEPLLL